MVENLAAPSVSFGPDNHTVYVCHPYLVVLAFLTSLLAPMALAPLVGSALTAPVALCLAEFNRREIYRADYI